MELNAAHKTFFTLLQAGLWSRNPESACFPLSPEMWEQIYKMAHKQTVEGIVFDGIMQLPEHHFPPRDLLLKWVVEVNSIEERNKRMNKAVAELYELFTKNHIPVLLRKGQGVAAYYENPLHRVCGDIDLFFPDKENFEQAGSLAEKNGAKIGEHERSGDCYMWRGFFVEHHRHLLDIYNPFLFGYLNRMQQEEYAHSVDIDIDGQNITLPSPVLTHLSVNAHILKHLLAFGVSIRQLCDSARVCYAYHDQIEAESLKKIYRKLGIYRWVLLLNRLLVDNLGMPEAYLPFPLAPRQKADWMMKDILRGGNFGQYGGLFSKETDEPQPRKYKLLHSFVIFCRYVRYAPGEACWFPVMHVYSDIRNWFNR